MSRASKYLRKKLQEGGLVPNAPEELKQIPIPNEQRAMPQPSLQMQVKPAGKAVNIANPNTAALPSFLEEQMKIQEQIKNDPNANTQLSVNPGKPREQSPEQLANAMGLSPEQFKGLQDAQNKASATMQSPEYQALLKRVEESKGEDAEALKQLEAYQQEFAAAQQQFMPQPQMAAAPAQAQQATAQPQMAASGPQRPAYDGTSAPDPNKYIGGSTSRFYLEDLGAWNASQETPKDNSGSNIKPPAEPTDKATSTSGVTSSGSISIPETRTVQDIPKVPDPGPKPEWTGGEAQKGRGSAWEAYESRLNDWESANLAYQKYLNEVAEIEKNNSGTNTMANTDDKGLPEGRGGEPTDLTGSGETKVTGVKIPGSSSGSGGAPVGIEVTKPTYTAPEVDVATLSEDEKVFRSQFPEGEAGTEQYKIARAKEAQKLVAQGAEQPRRGQFPEGEAGDIQYNAAIQRFRETPLAAEGTVTEAKDIQTVGEAGTVTGQAVDAQEITDVAEQAAPTAVTAPEDVAAASMEAKTIDEQKAVEAAKGEVSADAQAAEFEAQQAAQVATAQRDAEAEAAAQADAIEYDASQDAYVNKVTGKVATVEETAEAEAKTRQAITGMPAPDGEAAQIMSMYDFNKSQQRAIQGQKAKDKAIKQLKAQGVKDDDIAQQLADNPELIADQMEDLPSDVRTTLSGLPQEALVSVQMESLMAGMEDGEVPMWARPALAKVEANLAKRGMGKSSVGRDALFNAIIQSAIPLAQSNAAAIQQATAQDKQIAADFLAKNAGFQQQMELANLSNDQQMRLANLSALNAASADNLNAAQQTELANLNARMQTNLLQGKIAAEMNQAQLNVDQQRAVTNASMVANIDMAKFNAAQQVELANSKFMQSMVQTQFNADQQSAIQNATMQASLDLATLGANEKLRAQNAQAFLQMDMANLSNEQQAAVLTAQQRQQTLLSNQAAENAAAQFNAANEQQANQFMANLATTIQQFNVQSNSAREQFNATEANRIAAINAGNKLQADQFEAQLFADIAKFNEQQDYQRDQWNAANAQAVEQSNVQWRRQSNLADTAAQNAANQQNAQIAYNLTSQELSQVWQQLRDQAAYVRQSFENEQQRKAQLLATAISNEKFAAKSGSDAYDWYNDVIQ